jgi:hypothetical protein
MSRLAQLHPHHRDAQVSFQEEGHIYRVRGVPQQIVSVTTFVKEFFPKFNADATIARMMRSRGWSASNYFHMSSEQIKAQWEQTRSDAARDGTAMHRAIEAFLNRPEEECLQICATYAANQSLPDSVPGTIEFCYFLRFWHDAICKSCLRPYRTEWTVYDASKRLAGSIDLALYDPVSDPLAQQLVLVDWKRTKQVKLENRFEGGKEFWQHLAHCNWIHFCLQLNLYRHLLETNYGKQVTHMYVVLLHPNQSSYSVLSLPRMVPEVLDAIAHLPRNIIPNNDDDSFE